MNNRDKVCPIFGPNQIGNKINRDFLIKEGIPSWRPSVQDHQKQDYLKERLSKVQTGDQVTGIGAGLQDWEQEEIAKIGLGKHPNKSRYKDTRMGAKTARISSRKTKKLVASKTTLRDAQIQANVAPASSQSSPLYHDQVIDGTEFEGDAPFLQKYPELNVEAIEHLYPTVMDDTDSFVMEEPSAEDPTKYQDARPPSKPENAAHYSSYQQYLKTLPQQKGPDRSSEINADFTKSHIVKPTTTVVPKLNRTPETPEPFIQSEKDVIETPKIPQGSSWSLDQAQEEAIAEHTDFPDFEASLTYNMTDLDSGMEGEPDWAFFDDPIVSLHHLDFIGMIPLTMLRRTVTPLPKNLFHLLTKPPRQRTMKRPMQLTMVLLGLTKTRSALWSKSMIT